MKTINPVTNYPRKRGASPIFAILWTGFSLFWTAMALSGSIGIYLQRERTFSPEFLFPLAGLPFLAIGLAMLWSNLRPWIVRIKTNAPNVTISTGELHVGDEFVVGYSQSFKQAVEVRRVAFKLVFRETAEYQDSDRSSMLIYETPADEYNYAGQTLDAGGQLTLSRKFTIPRNGMHSFQAFSNWLSWVLKVKVDIVGWPDYQEDFEIPVGPTPAG